MTTCGFQKLQAEASTAHPATVHACQGSLPPCLEFNIHLAAGLAGGERGSDGRQLQAQLRLADACGTDQLRDAAGRDATM